MNGRGRNAKHGDMNGKRKSEKVIGSNPGSTAETNPENGEGASVHSGNGSAKGSANGSEKVSAPTGKSTSGDRSTFSPVDWFHAHALGGLKLDLGLADTKTKEFTDYMWPVSNNYFSPLNPIFLTSNYPLEVLNERALWFVRDGLVPLLWFFRMNPTPGDFKRRLIVNEKYGPFVPDAWRETVGSYRLVSRNNFKSEGPRKFLINAFAGEFFSTIKDLEGQLSAIAADVGSEELKKSEKIVYFAFKNHGFNLQGKEEYVGEYMHAVCRTFGSDYMRFVNWINYEGISDLHGYELIELDQGFLCGDSYLIHSAMRRGATIYGQTGQEPAADEKSVTLSTDHMVCWREKIKGECQITEDRIGVRESAKYFADFERAMLSHVNTIMPWPSWIFSWTRNLVGEISGRGNGRN